MTVPPPGRHAQVRDPSVLKALAHPLRGRLLGLLRLDGPSTATRLGERLGESSGATSYHLRQLEQYGFVEEVRREGRERWWQALHQMTSWSSDEITEQPGGLEANQAMQRHQVEAMGRQLRTWLDAAPDPDASWAGLSDYLLRLTPEQARQCASEVYEVLDRWSGAEPLDGALPVAFHTAVFPYEEQR